MQSISVLCSMVMTSRPYGRAVVLHAYWLNGPRFTVQYLFEYFCLLYYSRLLDRTIIGMMPSVHLNANAVRFGKSACI